MFVTHGLIGQQSALLSGLRSRLVVDALAFSFNPRGWTWALQLLITVWWECGIALWALGMSGGIFCPLQASQRSSINMERRDAKISWSNLNTQFNVLENHNQMSQLWLSVTSPAGWEADRVIGEDWTQSFQEGPDSIWPVGAKRSLFPAENVFQSKHQNSDCNYVVEHSESLNM